MNLGPKHDASKEREEKTFKHSKQSENERQRTGDEGITALEVLANTAEEKQTNHAQAKDGHGHDVELQEYNIPYSGLFSYFEEHHTYKKLFYRNRFNVPILSYTNI